MQDQIFFLRATETDPPPRESLLSWLLDTVPGTTVLTHTQNVGHCGNDNTYGLGGRSTKLEGSNISPSCKEKQGLAGERQLRN